MHMENTMPAFEAAVAAGADAIELDIQLTRDDVPVVYHDRTLGKLTGSRRRVCDLTRDELDRFDFSKRRGPRYYGVGVPSLDEVLDAYGGRLPLLLEIKADVERPRGARWNRLIESVIDAVHTRGSSPHVYILSFDARVLAVVRRRAPELRRVLNVDVRPPWSPAQWRSMRAVHAVCLPARFATVELGRRLQEYERQLWVYRCDTDRALERARRSGAQTFISDDPIWLRRSLEHER
jgi:glycerophosphoryl diester phosphodiesterase